MALFRTPRVTKAQNNALAEPQAALASVDADIATVTALLGTDTPEPVLEAYIIRMIKPGQLRSMVYNTFGGLTDAEAKGVWYTENWVGWSVFDIKLAPVQPRG